jgi:hypothetical protein
MKPHVAMIAAATVIVFAFPTRAVAADAQSGGTRCQVLVKSPADDGEASLLCGPDDDCQIVKVNKDGVKKIIKLAGGELADLGDKLDKATQLKLLDARIGNLKAVAQLKTDLAIRRLEAKKLELSGRPDAEVLAKKKEMNALKARIADAELDYEQKVKQLAPDGMAELYLLDLDDETTLLDMTLGLPPGSHRKIIKRLRIDADEAE